MKRTAATLAVLTAITWALAACGSSADDDVASVADATAAADTEADLMPEFVDCLTAVGIPAGLDADGQITFDDGSEVRVASDPDGESEVVIDGEDVTESWNACKEQVPGVEPFGDHAEMDVAAMNEAGMTWAACARENGYPAMPDPKDGVVTLPSDLTPESVAALGETCPAFTDEGTSFGLDVPESWSPEYAQSIMDALFGVPAVAEDAGE